MPRIGVLLSGCGVFDGAEIHESAFTLLALAQKGATIVCCAPNTEFDVIDHIQREPTGEKRNVLTESARIARGDIKDIATLKADDLDALIIPGGFGAAKNLSDFAEKGADCTVNPEVARFVGEMLAAKKPIGAICIAPGTLAAIARQAGIAAKLTIGQDVGTAAQITKLGCVHENLPVDEICIDDDHPIVSTPAYMLGPGPAEVFEGIRKLVDKIVSMAGK